MKHIRTFVMDFAGFFIITVGGLCIVIAEVLTQMMHMLRKLYDQVLVPGTVELLADASFMLTVVYQGYLSMKSDTCLALSKWLLHMSQRAHDQSERLIDKTWMH